MTHAQDNGQPKVLMIGAGRDVKGGITTIVNSYFNAGLDKAVDLTYLATMHDGSKLRKLYIAAAAYIKFCLIVKRYDIIHIHMASDQSFTRKSLFVKRARKSGKKIIIHQHGGNFDDFFLHKSNERKQEKIKKVFSLADKVIVLSEEWRDFFGQYVCDESKIMLLHNGVVIPAYQKTDYSDHNILFLGRLTVDKGAFDLLRSIPSVLEQVPDAVFYFGANGDVNQCIKIARENGFEDHVRFLGWVRGEEKEKYLKKCSVFILPSHYEAMPMSVLEAMSYGLATISTNVGGIPQMIRQNADGIRVDAEDIPAIVEALIRLLTDEALKTKLGQAGKRKVETTFDLSANINKLCTLYKDLASDCRPAPNHVCAE